MSFSEENVDVVIVGAGPIGLSCGIEIQKVGLDCLLFDKGALIDSLCRHPRNLIWFSTPELLEIGDIPMIPSGPKPTGQDVSRYYQRVARHYRLPVRLYERVEAVRRTAGETARAGREPRFTVETSRGRAVRCRAVVLATGFFDHPNLMGVPGEELPKVSHYYDSPFPYYEQRVAVIGGANSAVEVALELWRNGARDVTLVHRGKELAPGIKYWVRPDIENRIREGTIAAYFETSVERIEEDHIVLSLPDERTLRLGNDFVLAMTGYHADFDFLSRAGIHIDAETLKPALDPETMETNVPGLYCAGVIVGGRDSGTIFIENSRIHSKRIAAHLASGNHHRRSERENDEDLL